MRFIFKEIGFLKKQLLILFINYRYCYEREFIFRVRETSVKAVAILKIFYFRLCHFGIQMLEKN